MSNILRFQLYSNPSRHDVTQLGSDTFVSKLPAYGYGQTVQIDKDEEGSSSIPHPYYVVANISRIKRESDPEHPGESRVIYEVYLARKEEWPLFGEPEEFERIRNGTLL